MSYISQLQSIWKNRRRQVLIGLAVAGASVAVGAYFYYNYRSRSSTDADQRKSLSPFRGAADGAGPQESTPLVSEKEDDEQLQLHFNKIQTIADSTTLPSVVPHLRARLLALLDTAPLTTALSSGQTATSSPAGSTSAEPLSTQEKLRLWEELCVVSFCRALGAVLSLALLGLFVRAQLNVLGRRVFLDAASGGHSSPSTPPSLSVPSQHRFLSLADYLPHMGLPLLVADLRGTLRPLLATRSLKEPLNCAGLQGLLTSLLQAVQGQEDANKLWHKYIMPPMGSNFYKNAPPGADQGAVEALSEADDALVQELIAELHAVLRSDSFLAALHASAEVLVEQVAGDVFREGAGKGGTRTEVPLAKLLPKVSGAASNLLDVGRHPTSLQFLQAPSVGSFCAKVYSDESDEQ